ncbi:hypothetical protein AB3M83_02650 [Microbacterium sp. 179-B 1A2 NHS]|uniref:hypothetical protein n=1 Tax=Microbacterium sp. 179-B 1A2 NHS TaxID=3142383 RepID=UPI0039A3CCBB
MTQPKTDAARSRTLSRGDRTALLVLMAAGTILAGATVVAAVIRCVDVLSGGAAEVLAEFSGTPATAPIGVDGAAVQVSVDSAVLHVDELPVFSVVALVLQQAVLVIAVVTVVACLLLLARSVLRDRVFSRRNTVLVTVAGVTTLLATAAHPFFGNMAANGAFAAISDGTFDNVVMTIEPATLLFTAFVAALGSTVFTVGERLQRDTDGLV